MQLNKANEETLERLIDEIIQYLVKQKMISEPKTNNERIELQRLVKDDLIKNLKNGIPALTPPSKEFKDLLTMAIKLNIIAMKEPGLASSKGNTLGLLVTPVKDLTVAQQHTLTKFKLFLKLEIQKLRVKLKDDLRNEMMKPKPDKNKVKEIEEKLNNLDKLEEFFDKNAHDFQELLKKVDKNADDKATHTAKELSVMMDLVGESLSQERLTMRATFGNDYITGLPTPAVKDTKIEIKSDTLAAQKEDQEQPNRKSLGDTPKFRPPGSVDK